MERVMCDSPSKDTFIQEPLYNQKSSPTSRTPMRQNENKQRKNAFTSGMTGFNVLPAHITPPSGLTKFMARNPFEADLTSRLHLSVISPTVFTKVTPTHRNSPSFSWSVDELALIQPAKIEEYPFQQMHSNDPDLEIVAQAAINKFFAANQIIPSPWDDGRKDMASKSEMLTPSRPLEDLNVTRESQKSKKDCWTQTVLTLPPVLPKELEEALKPYFTFNQDQNVENEDANSSNNSLRRKLFFNHDDCTDEEEDISFCLSPTKTHGSMILPPSPPQSGMLVHGTPLKGCSYGLQRTHGTPYAGNISPPTMSPICNDDMSCQSIRSRCQFPTRLDFTTDMSIDMSLREDKELKRIEDVECDTNTSPFRSKIINGCLEIRGEKHEPFTNDETHHPNETAEMLSRETTPLKRVEIPESIMKMCKSKDILGSLKNTTHSSKIHSNDSYPDQNNTLLGNSCAGQQSDVNSGQDTGYQTYSMSNITSNTDNCSITAPITKSFNWNEKILSNGGGDEIRLSGWQENMINMFSSTPSKYTRRREN